MLRELSLTSESWPLATPFRISRGTKVAADVIVVEIHEQGHVGRGEAVPYARYGETIASVSADVQGIAADVVRGIDRQVLCTSMRAGAARNAIDCALWDLEASVSGKSVKSRLECRSLPALTTALTVSLDTPDKMGAAASRITDAKVIKVKVDASDPAAQLRAVRAAAPGATLIADANEGWTFSVLEAMQPVLVETRVSLLEQPLPATDDAALEGFRPAVPICADESCHVAADLPKLRGRYQAVNIKLDKTGGLTGALEMLNAARAAEFHIMVGCMICTSLGIAPAFHVARHAAFVDLDGPLWLTRDRAGGVRLENGLLYPPSASLWGTGNGAP